MDLHSLKNSPGAKHAKKRLGRGHGSGHGKTSGKGHKGQRARSGHNRKPAFEGGQLRIIQRLPIRGFNNVNRKEFRPVNVGQLDRFDSGTEVTVDVLKAAGLANGIKAGIKILGVGDLSKNLTVHAHHFSATARAKIEAAGGSCVVDA
jgi:large subunit ribosomal protein L15